MRRTTLTMILAVILAACSGTGASATPTPAGGGAGSSAGPSASPQAGGPGSSASASNACSLLSPGEIDSIVGFTVGDGVLQTSDQSSDCQWTDQADDANVVGVTIQPYDDTLWQAMSSVSAATPVSGVGEAAYKGYPHAGDLAIKDKGYEVDIGIIAFNQQTSEIDGENLSLAGLLLPRL